MRTLVVSVVVLLGLAGGGSTPFLNSAATSKSLVSDPEIVGEWISEGDTITRAEIASQNAGKNEVTLTVRHKGELKSQVDLDVTLTNIGDARGERPRKIRQEVGKTADSAVFRRVGGGL